VQGPKALREEAIRRTQWHDPIPQILLATQECMSQDILYMMNTTLRLLKCWKSNFDGDAAHLSPFKDKEQTKRC
jgi:hypothetical protein